MKTIRELESGRQELLDSLNFLLEDLGETLLGRIGDDDSGKTDRAEYYRLLEEINAAAGLVGKIEEDTVHLRETEESILRAEEDTAALKKDLAASYRKLGEAVLEGEAYSHLGASFRSRRDVLVPKIQSLEERLAELGNRMGANVLALIGKSARTMVIRGFLARDRENLDRLYEQAGEQFARPEEAASFTGGEPAALIAAAAVLKRRSDSLAEKLAALRAERRKIAGALGAEGGAARRRGALERQIASLKGELRVLYRKVGEAAEEGAGRESRGSPLSPEDRLILDRIGAKRKTLKDYEKNIQKIRTAMAIDKEKAEMERLEKAIGEQRARIASAEKTIEELSGHIAAAEDNIKKLKGSLQEHHGGKE